MITRLLKFSAVGAIGIAVQLAVLWALTRSGVNYMIATAFAVEAAVLHNFLWHQRFTWFERSIKDGARGRLLRFHLSNGIVSLCGSLVIMRLLVGVFGLPVITSNLISISICALTNFVLSDRWVFIDTGA